MRYLLAILLPPLAVLLCGKPIQFLLSVVLTLCLWIPGVIHALCVVNAHLADKRTGRPITEVAAEAVDMLTIPPECKPGQYPEGYEQ